MREPPGARSQEPGARSQEPPGPERRGSDSRAGYSTGGGGTSPRAAAQAATCAREWRPSLLRMLATWVPAVPVVTTRRSPIWRLVRPWATSAATARSRSVRGAQAASGPAPPGRPGRRAAGWGLLPGHRQLEGLFQGQRLPRGPGGGEGRLAEGLPDGHQPALQPGPLAGEEADAERVPGRRGGARQPHGALRRALRRGEGGAPFQDPDVVRAPAEGPQGGEPLPVRRPGRAVLPLRLGGHAQRALGEPEAPALAQLPEEGRPLLQRGPRRGAVALLREAEPAGQEHPGEAPAVPEAAEARLALLQAGPGGRRVAGEHVELAEVVQGPGHPLLVAQGVPQPETLLQAHPRRLEVARVAGQDGGPEGRLRPRHQVPVGRRAGAGRRRRRGGRGRQGQQVRQPAPPLAQVPPHLPEAPQGAGQLQGPHRPLRLAGRRPLRPPPERLPEVVVVDLQALEPRRLLRGRAAPAPPAAPAR